MATTLRDVLRRKCRKEALTYADTLPALEQSARKLLTYTQAKFPYYTLHDFSHSEQVERLLDVLISDPVKETLNAEEIYFLIVSAWFHDWGMIGTYDEEPDSIRDDHHLRSEQFILERYGDLPGIDHAQAIFIGRICKGHRQVDLMDKNQYPAHRPYLNKFISERFLAACLRLADECDVTHSRTPEIILRSIDPKGTNLKEFQKHRSTYGLVFPPGVIEIACTSFNPEEEETLRILGDKIQNTLDDVAEILESKGIFLSQVNMRIERRRYLKPCRLHIDTQAILELLMGDRLYPRADACIRELLQNAIDTCSLRLQTEKGRYVPAIRCEHTNDGRIIVQDNGLGMDAEIVETFLLNIGRSYYSSESFRELIKSTDTTFDPISIFGVGIMSCFMLADRVKIETRTETGQAFRLEIERNTKTFKLEEIAGINEAGTRITLFLKPNVDFSLLDTVRFYARHIRIPITIVPPSGEATVLPEWTLTDYLSEVIKETVAELPLYVKETEDGGLAGAFFLFRPDIPLPSAIKTQFRSLDKLCSRDRGLWVSRQGIFVADLADLLPPCFKHTYGFVNLGAEQLDINVARDSFVRNAKFDGFAQWAMDETFNLHRMFLASLMPREQASNEKERKKVNDAVVKLLPKRIPFDSLYDAEVYVKASQMQRKSVDALYERLVGLFAESFLFSTFSNDGGMTLNSLERILQSATADDLVVADERYAYSDVQTLFATVLREEGKSLLVAGGEWEQFSRSYLHMFYKQKGLELKEVRPPQSNGRSDLELVDAPQLAQFLPANATLVRPQEGVLFPLLDIESEYSREEVELTIADVFSLDAGAQQEVEVRLVFNFNDPFLQLLSQEMSREKARKKVGDLVSMYFKSLVAVRVAMANYQYHRIWGSSGEHRAAVQNISDLIDLIENAIKKRLGVTQPMPRVADRLLFTIIFGDSKPWVQEEA